MIIITSIEETDYFHYKIDVINRKINLCISDEEMAKRISEFHWEFPANNYQRYLRLFVKNVGSMAQGCVWDV